jgi:putative nucleotidyltransferase with HDIG domain
MKGSPRILIIDDEETIRELLSSFLGKHGYLVQAVSNRSAAITELASKPYDVVLLDTRLPGENGIQLLRNIKKSDPCIEVIVITGYATVESVLKTLKSGAYDYISKPFSLDELKIVIDRCYEKQRLAGENIELREVAALFEVSRLITSKVDLETLLNQVLVAATRITEAKRGSVLILDERRRLRIRAAIGLSESVVQKTRIRLGEGIAGVVVKRGEELLITDIDKDKRFKPRRKTRYETKSFISVPLVSLPLKAHGRVLGVINVSDKISGEIFTYRDLHIVSILAGQAAVAIENAQLFGLLQRSYMETVRVLVKNLDSNDRITPDHSGRVAQFAVAIAGEMGLRSHEIEGLRMAAFLHDIGKHRIDIDVLAKPGRLTKKEWNIVRKHPLMSAQMIEGISFPWDVIPLVRHHHEQMDGRGFPGGLKGEAIPLGARILAVADAFEAMTADRPYRKARSRAKALVELKYLASKRYDRRVVRAIEAVLKKGKM